MDFKNFIQKNDFLKETKLGGIEAQFKMAPELRLQYSKESIAANNPRKAAVLALFYPNKKNETVVLLTQRASYKGIHSAQISFPGGKIEKIDINLEEAARRETYEEVGVQPSSIEIIRELTAVFIPPSNFLATPFLGFVKQKPIFIPNHEVASVIEVLVSDLLNENNVTKVNLNTSYMKNMEVPCFKLNGHIIWGATAMMLSEIKELLK